jgi:leader peptidase (prepilin peptidase)/N-methyltransferase
VFLIWLAMMGGAIGSFLNVVVYRLPRELSLVTPGSFCPVCKQPIRWYDNLPVLGWFLLAGRCRDCRQPIAFRYPLIEAATVGLFVWLGLMEYMSRGANLPGHRLTYIESGGVLVYHLVLICTLFPAWLIEQDEDVLPWKLMVPAIVVGIAGAAWPVLHPVAALPGLRGEWAGVVDVLAGLAVGGLIAAAAFALANQADRPAAVLLPVVTGLFLGWQATAVLSGLCFGAWLLSRWLWHFLPILPKLPLTGWWFAGTLGWLWTWRRLVDLAPWLG